MKDTELRTAKEPKRTEIIELALGVDQELLDSFDRESACSGVVDGRTEPLTPVNWRGDFSDSWRNDWMDTWRDSHRK